MRSRKNGVYSLLLVLGLVAAEALSGCGGGSGVVPTQAKWTVMVFLNAANNLEEFGIQDMNEMEMIGSTVDVNIVVQMKRITGFDSSNGDWTGTRRYFVSQDANTSTITSPVIENLGSSVDMGDPQTLADFIAWAQENYPADHYLLDIWDHGAGWRTQVVDNPITRGVSYDDVTGNNIATNDLGWSTQATPPLDIIAFDASLMQMAEVAYELRGSTPIVVGSEESPPGEGYPYNVILAPLASNPDLTPTQWATNIVQLTVADTATQQSSAYGLTQSAIRTADLPGLVTAVNTLSAALIANRTTYASQLQQARNQAQDYVFTENKDLWHYADLTATLTGNGAITSAATGVKTAIGQAVFAEAHYGAGMVNSHGLAIYVPAPASYLTSYNNLDWSAATDWDSWLPQQAQ